MRKRTIYITRLLVILSVLQAITGNLAFSQSLPGFSPGQVNNLKVQFGSAFIQNIGQYGKTIKGYENMGPVLYGYEGPGMPVLFTTKGIIHLQRKIEMISRREEKKLEMQGLPEAEIERKRNVTDRVITMEWAGLSHATEIIAENKTADYHTYGILTEKAYGYKKIIYKNAYPGIDIVYSFAQNDKMGFEYSLVVQPGADIGAVKIEYGGDVKSIKTDSKGNLIIRSDIEGISTTVPVSYYGENLLNKDFGDVKTDFYVNDRQISIVFPQGYEKTKAVIIDPFVSTTGNLSGLNAGKAKDVDFDYAGNIYVTGGGSQASPFSLAKYNAAGVLQWTFNGTLAIPLWSSNSYYGGSVVDKPTGKIYLGQGFIYPAGFRVIRISTTGLYDNYISTPNGSFTENWKMYWNCNNGLPQILIAGGGINSPVNFGILTPPSTTISSLNITGLTGFGQDIVDLAIDPANNDMYTTYASLILSPGINNKMYKNTAPYSAASVVWNVPSGYTTLSEAANRPYLNAVSLVDNSANIYSVNASYLYYWDGKNLQAYNKATGAGAGTPIITANTAKMQGGIIADACDNIFVGEANGFIKVYNFNGSVFSDAPADIAIPGFPGKAVYDLAYDESRKLIYASGDGFVGSFDVSMYCVNTIYTLNVVPNCLTATATASVSPTPPPGSTVTYVLYIGNTQIATNTTGVFTGLDPNTGYNIIATVNQLCSGTQATNTFFIPGPAIGIIKTNTTCGASTGSITAAGSGTAGPYTYNINGGAFQPSGVFTGLAAGIYTIIVKDLAGCPNDTVVAISNSNGPTFTLSQTNADCGSNNGTVTVTASGGTAPYQYSINGGTTYQSNNFFTGLVGGQYTLIVKDANNCINAAIVTITNSAAPFITAVPAAATCGSNNGTITAFGSGGTAPLQYSINGNTFQVSNVFNGTTPGTYTVYVKDANNCTSTTSVTVGNSPAPTVSAVSTPAACGNVNGIITATGNGGIAPLQYSINGGSFQTGNIFTGLAAGVYTVAVKDATGCTNITSVTVASTGGPAANASSTSSACNTNTGTITASASGGVPAYQYSINGITFQTSNLFTGLAAGNYVVYARDAAGCIGTSSIVVGNTAGPSINVAVTPTSCNVNDGMITITASGGAPGYTYSIDGTNYVAGNIFTGLAAGNYTAYVADANGCIKSASVIVPNVSGLSLAVSTITSSCNTNNGVITATAAGGAAPLQYSIDGTNYFASNVFTGIAPGVYTVYVKDANNCIVTKQATVLSVSGPSISVTAINATCAGANGVIVATGSGGQAPLTYSINGTVYQPSGTFINVAPATYTVYVKDATGCIATEVVIITTSGAGPGITTFTVRTADAYPCNDNVGKIDQFRVNGVNCATCTYSINFGPFLIGNEPIWSALAIGTYAITAKDAAGCTKTIFATIGVATLTTATATTTAADCSLNNGTITLTGVGANTPYHASITGIGGPFVTFDPTYTFTGLAPGLYTVIMADDEDYNGPNDPGNCITTFEITVPSIGGPSINTTQINGTCGQNNGSISASGSGGLAPYQYRLNNGAYFTSGIFNNLGPGVYAVSVRDANLCVNVTSVTLVNPAGPAVSAIPLATSCNLNNGTITATGSGGAAPYEYSINGTIFQTSNIFTNLAAGAYTLYVKDANQCYSTLPVTIVNTQLPKVTAFTIAASCNNNDGSIVATGSLGTTPYTFSINGAVYQSSSTFSNLPAGFYTVYIKDARNCITTTGVSVANIGAPSFNQAVTPATCSNATGIITITASGGTAPYEYSSDGGVTYQISNIFTGLLPGNYVGVVKDANGCLATKTIFVSNTNGPQTLTALVVNAACGLNNGTVTATATGGTAPLQYSINGTTYQASPVFNGVGAGSYTLYVKDANNCIKTLPVLVNNLAGPAAVVSSSPASCGSSDGTITVTATGGTLALTYSNNGGTSFQASNIFTGLTAGTYNIVVKDARGCIYNTSIDVTAINFVGNLAGVTGGVQVCNSGVVSAGGTVYVDQFCNLIAKVVPSGVAPVTGMINSCVIIDGSVQVFNVEPYVQRHFDIEPVTNPNNATATITLYFKDQEFVDFNTNRSGFPALPTLAGGGNSDPARANLKVTQYHGVPVFPHNSGNPSPGFYSVNGGAGVLIVPTSVNYNSGFGYWEVTFPITGFSGFYVHTNIHFPLPITLEYFRGNRQQEKHVLNWKVNCNTNPGAVMELERSADARNFSSIYSVVTDAARCLQPFDYTDSVPMPGINYYRLKITAADGRVSYSNVLSFVNGTGNLEIIRISPNPVTDGRFLLEINSMKASSLDITVIDMQGRTLHRQAGFVTAGINRIPVNAEKLASGSYAVSVKTANAVSATLRFVKE